MRFVRQRPVAAGEREPVVGEARRDVRPVTGIGIRVQAFQTNAL